MTKPSILFVTPSRLYPASTGGHWRSVNVAQGLADAGYDVTILSLAGRHGDYKLGSECSYMSHSISNNLVELTDLRLAQGILQSVFRRLGNSKAWSYFGLPKIGLSPLAKSLLSQKDVIIYDSPFVDKSELTDSSRAILLSHNLETEILEQSKSFIDSLWLPIVRKVENHQRLNFDIVLSCADSDTMFYKKPNGTVIELGNGMTALKSTVEEDEQARARLGLGSVNLCLVFVGSGYQPNRDGLEFVRRFCESNHELLANWKVKVVVVGTVSSEKYEDDVLRITGPVDEVKPYLMAADAALNPITWGSGSNIKVFEALAAGLPVISTEFGLRGLSSSIKSGLDTFDAEEDLRNLLSKLHLQRSALKVLGSSILAAHKKDILMNDMIIDKVVPLIEQITADIAEVDNELE